MADTGRQECPTSGQILCLLLISLVLLVMLLGWGAGDAGRSARVEAADGAADSPSTTNPDADHQRRKVELDAMRRRAEATKVYRLDGAQRIALKLSPAPLMRYSDQPTSIVDATLWAYTDAEGRPVVLQKIEDYRRPWTKLRWLYGMFSLCDGLIEAQWRDGRQWQSTKPGIALRPLPDGPRPAANRAARLRQIKDLARRFSVDWYNSAKGREEMRLLPQPLLRYQGPDSGILDGALVAFTAKGTNPDFAMVIELDGKNLADSVWKYAASRLTSAQLVLRLDRKEVWSVPDVPLFLPQGPAKYDTWAVFFEAVQTVPNRRAND